MGRLARAVKAKGKQKQLPRLGKNIFNPFDKVGKTKKPNSRGVEKRLNEEERNVKISRKVLDLAKKQLNNEEDLDQNCTKDKLKVSCLLDDIELGLDSEIESEKEDTFYDDFFKNHISDMDRELFDQFSSVQKSDKIKKSITSQLSENKVTVDSNLSEEILSTYQQIGFLMSRYSSGPVPKALKVLPVLADWKTLLNLMEPVRFTAAAIFKITKYFVASAKPHVLQEYFQTVLLPRIRDDIAEYGKLNYHVYNALCNATHKASLFFRFMLFPLCLANNCSLNEAVVLSSVLHRCSFPSLHAAVAIAKMSSFPYSGCISIFIRVLLQKRFALPNKALDQVFHHFLSFGSEMKIMPVVWHQSLLMFIQNYGSYFDAEKCLKLKQLTKLQNHLKITPVILEALSQCSSKTKKAESMDMDLD